MKLSVNIGGELWKASFRSLQIHCMVTNSDDDEEFTFFYLNWTSIIRWLHYGRMFFSPKIFVSLKNRTSRRYTRDIDYIAPFNWISKSQEFVPPLFPRYIALHSMFLSFFTLRLIISASFVLCIFWLGCVDVVVVGKCQPNLLHPTTSFTFISVAIKKKEKTEKERKNSWSSRFRGVPPINSG